MNIKFFDHKSLQISVYITFILKTGKQPSVLE
jgi:hypothetical protein